MASLRAFCLAMLCACLSAACGGPGTAAARVVVPGVDPLSGELAAVEVGLPGAEPSQVRGPSGILLLGAAVEGRRVVSGGPPDCALRRLPGGGLAAVLPRCAELLGAYAALERARAFLLSTGAEALPPPLVLAEHEQRGEGASSPPGLAYLPAVDAFSLRPGPPGARVPAALNHGEVVRESALRQLRALGMFHAEAASGVALFLGAAAAGHPAYRAASVAGGDPRGDLDLSRPLPPSATESELVASALWAWGEASGDLLGAARASLAAARALTSGGSDRDAGAEAQALLSLVAGQLFGAERDQACAVFRARAGGDISACP